MTYNPFMFSRTKINIIPPSIPEVEFMSDIFVYLGMIDIIASLIYFFFFN